MQTEPYLSQQAKQSWLKSYERGTTSRTSSLPIAYILLKEKKHFEVERPIISYKFFIFAKLSRATAMVRDVLQRDTLSCSFGLSTFPAMMKQIVDFFQSVAEDVKLQCFEQDLVGIFTSIPVERIM